MKTVKNPSSSKIMTNMFRVSALSLAVFQLLATSANAQDKAPASFRGISGDTLSVPAAPSVFNQAVGSADYAANAKVAKIIIDLDRNGVPADGQTAVTFTLRLLAPNGKPVKGVSFVTIENSGGRLQLPKASTDELGAGRMDVDKVTTGTQVRVTDGLAQFSLLAPAEPMDVRVKVTAGREQVTGVVSFLPELRDMVAAGLVEGVINLSNISSSQLAQPRSRDVFEQEIRKFEYQFNNGKSSYAARVAFFVKGEIKGEHLLTAAYDSDKDSRERMLRDIQPDQMYPVYGDASLRGFDAKSISPLYVRIDKNKHYALFGDFNTGAGFSQQAGGGSTASLVQRQLGNYSRTLNGARLHGEKENYTVNVFVSHDNLKQVVEEFAGRGISGPYAVSNNTGIQNTEKIELVVRDRRQPGKILSASPMSRFVDYSFEPFSGRILFTQPIPTFDKNLNPVSVRITYEVEQGGESFTLAGVDGQLRVNEKLEVGGSMVKDTNPLAPFSLGSVNLGWKISDNTLLVVEAATTTSTVNTTGVNTYTTPALGTQSGEVSGNALRAELTHQGEGWKIRANAAKTDPEFNNPASGYAGGRQEAGVYGESQLGDKTKVYAEVAKSKDVINDATRQGAQVGATYKASERLTLDVAIKTVKDDVGTGGAAVPVTPLTAPIGAPSGGFFGNGSGALDPTTGTPLINNGGAFSSPGSPIAGNLDATTVKLGASFKATDKLSLRGEVETSVDDGKHNRVAIGADYQIAEQAKVYARAEVQKGLDSPAAANPADSSNVLVAGVQTEYMQGGQLFTEYRVRDASSDQDMQLATGVRNVWDVSEGLRLSTSAERLSILSGTGQAATALTGGADWTADPLWRASGRLEWRRLDANSTQAGSDSYLSTLLLARKMDRDWTLLARNYFLLNNNKSTGDLTQDRFQIGAAYRDNDTNRINALAKYEYKTEKDNTTAAGYESQAHILSTHVDYHPSRPWWWTGRAAAKWVKEDFAGVKDSYSAYLLGGRVTYDISEKWSLGLMTSVLLSPNGGARQWAQGAEVGYQLQTNLWVSGGLNWSGFEDRDLTGSEYTRKGAYLRLRWKFDEDLFRGAKPETNRTLDRTN